MITTAMNQLENYFKDVYQMNNGFKELEKGYLKNKQNLLTNTLFKDSLIIEKEVEYVKPLTCLISDIAENKQFIQLIFDSLDSKFKEFEIMDIEDFYSSTEYLIRSIATNAITLAENKLHMNLDRVLADGTKFKAPQGMKMSKFFKKVITNPEKLELVQTEYSKFFTAAKVKGTLCLSIHPLDYLTVSDNQSGWSSCFSTLGNSGGEYKVSTLALLNSPNTIVAYFKEDEDYYYPEMGIKWNSKKWRTLITLADDFSICHIGRHYPFTLDSAVAPEILKAVSTVVGQEYPLVSLEGNEHLEIVAPDNFYNDASGINYISGYTADSALAKGLDCVLDICPDSPICPNCGQGHDGESDSMYCYYCCKDKFPQCKRCGQFSEDELNCTDIGKICDDCYADLCVYCDHCGDITLDFKFSENGDCVCFDCFDQESEDDE